MKRRLAALLVPLVLMVSGCTRAEPDPAAGSAGPPPFADCTALGTAPAAARAGGQSGTPPVGQSGTPAAARSTTAAASEAMPSMAGLALPCFTGNATVDLGALRGPMVINLWASWCTPCRKELPAFQRLAGQAGGKLHVLGVDVRDDRSSARSLAAELGLTFPTLFDPQEQLGAKLTRPYLPVTVFLDGEGRVRHIHDTGALDDRTLAELIERHLGVVVPA